MTDIVGEIRFSFAHAPSMRFIRRPITTLPEGEVTGWVNNGKRLVPAMFRDGEWCDLNHNPISWKPTHWTVPDVEAST